LASAGLVAVDAVADGVVLVVVVLAGGVAELLLIIVGEVLLSE